MALVRLLKSSLGLSLITTPLALSSCGDDVLDEEIADAAVSGPNDAGDDPTDTDEDKNTTSGGDDAGDGEPDDGDDSDNGDSEPDSEGDDDSDAATNEPPDGSVTGDTEADDATRDSGTPEPDDDQEELEDEVDAGGAPEASGECDTENARACSADQSQVLICQDSEWMVAEECTGDYSCTRTPDVGCRDSMDCPQDPEPGVAQACETLDSVCSYEEGLHCLCTDESPRGQFWRCTKRLTCDDGCYNQNCPGATEMCVADTGACGAVECVSDRDCCGLAGCDNLTSRCDNDSSPFFFCNDDGMCQRADAMSYDGPCRRLVDALPIQTCDEPCPEEQPEPGSRCMANGETCSYPAAGGVNNCECSGRQWQECAFEPLVVSP